MEIASGRRKHKEEECRLGLVPWVWELYGDGKILDAVNERLNMDFNAQEMEGFSIVGLYMVCAHPINMERPSQDKSQVLKFKAPLPYFQLKCLVM